MFLTDLEVARQVLKSSFYTEAEDSVIKRRVRALARRNDIKPIEKREGVWVYDEEDIPKFREIKCPLKQKNDQTRRITKSSGRYQDMDAFEKALALSQRPKRTK